METIRQGEIGAWRTIQRNCIEIVLRTPNGVVIWDEIVIDKERELDANKVLSISYDLAQMLLDQLWNCGIRPSDGIGSAGEKKALEDHISDLQVILLRLLGMVEQTHNEILERKE